MLVNVWRGREVFEALQREGVIVRPMDGYGLPEYVRITVGLPEENRRCVRTLARVLELPA
jgi:histidinol-phosphate aminotransferase